MANLADERKFVEALAAFADATDKLEVSPTFRNLRATVVVQGFLHTQARMHELYPRNDRQLEMPFG